MGPNRLRKYTRSPPEKSMNAPPGNGETRPAVARKRKSQRNPVGVTMGAISACSVRIGVESGERTKMEDHMNCDLKNSVCQVMGIQDAEEETFEKWRQTFASGKNASLGQGDGGGDEHGESDTKH